MRMAANHSEVIQKIKADTGVQVEMISPKREAELSWAGIQLDTSHLPIGMMFEIGGGSAQIARIENGHIAESQSLPLGTGRVLAESGLGSPADSAAEQRAAHYIAAQLEELTIVSCGGLVASSGGVGRGLWRALHPDGEKLIHRNELDYLVWTASRLTVDRLVNRFNVKQKRAGTLLPGAMIYRAMLDHFGIEEFAVSEFGIREGAIIEISRGQK
jgi:exopolyphosphatase/guanosine-5'-triphosphate,3'-diphosphate pyrophosphatase